MICEPLVPHRSDASRTLLTLVGCRTKQTDCVTAEGGEHEIDNRGCLLWVNLH